MSEINEMTVTAQDIRRLVGSGTITAAMQAYKEAQNASPDDANAAQIAASYRVATFLAAIDLSRDPQPLEHPPGTPVRSAMEICALASQALTQTVQNQAELAAAGV